MIDNTHKKIHYTPPGFVELTDLSLLMFFVKRKKTALRQVNVN